MTLTANAARNARLHADSFIRNQGTVTFFRGSNLGTSPVASQAAGTTNITFTQAPIFEGRGRGGGNDDRQHPGGSLWIDLDLGYLWGGTCPL